MLYLVHRAVRQRKIDIGNGRRRKIIRNGQSHLCAGPEDRTENIRRIGEVAKLFVDSGTIVLTAFISPYKADRDNVRSIMDKGDFIEVFVDCDLAVCEERDPKGLYKKARAGIIPEFTGISAPYEAPDNPEIVVNTSNQSVAESVETVLNYLKSKGYINKQ